MRVLKDPNFNCTKNPNILHNEFLEFVHEIPVTHDSDDQLSHMIQS